MRRKWQEVARTTSVLWAHLSFRGLPTAHVTDQLVHRLGNNVGHLIKSVDFDGCFNLTDDSLSVLSECCTSLETLVVTECKNLTIAARWPHGLKNCVLNRCSRVDDNVVRTIAEGSPKLRSFATAHCFGVSDVGVKLLTDRCQELLHLDFQFCSITDEALHQVSTKCLSLGFLDISGCNDVTDAGLITLKQCQHLGIVLANGCPQFDSQLVGNLNRHKLIRAKRLRDLLSL